MNNKHYFFIVLAMLLFIFACPLGGRIDYAELPAFSDQGINVIVEIPAGSNHKIEYNYQTGKFENDLENGSIRIIDFLPYPANYGFIPGTHMDIERGGDGDALDVLVIAESLSTGSLIEVQAIAALLLLDNGEIDTKIIAVPIDSSMQIIRVKDFRDFLINYDAAKKIIEDWFLSYKGLGVMEFLGWEDEKYALNEIKRWEKN